MAMSMKSKDANPIEFKEKMKASSNVRVVVMSGGEELTLRPGTQFS